MLYRNNFAIYLYKYELFASQNHMLLYSVIEYAVSKVWYMQTGIH